MVEQQKKPENSNGKPGLWRVEQYSDGAGVDVEARIPLAADGFSEDIARARQYFAVVRGAIGLTVASHGPGGASGQQTIPIPQEFRIPIPAAGTLAEAFGGAVSAVCAAEQRERSRIIVPGR